MRFVDSILIVGTDISYVNSLDSALQKLGYICYPCYTNTAAIQLTFEYFPDIVIYLPEDNIRNPFELYSIIKESSLTFDIPFLLIANDKNREDIQFALELGIDGVYDKNTRIADLQKIIDVRIKKHKRLRKESEKTFYKQFDITASPVVIYNSDFRVVSSNDSFKMAFDVKEEQPLWEWLKFEKEEFQRLSYKVFAANDGQEFFKYNYVQGREVTEYMVIVSSLNTFFAKKSAFLLFYSLKNILNGKEPVGFTAFNLREIANNGMGMLSRWNDELKEKEQAAERLSDKNTNCSSKDMAFTKRQMEVLELSIQGLPMKQIADKLFISEKTVEKYRASLMEKTGSRNIIELVIFAIRNKYVNV